MSQVVCNKAQEEYQDDFEKDLDWLISEESRSGDQGSDCEDIEAEIEKELVQDEKLQRRRRKQVREKKKRRSKAKEMEAEEEEEEEEEERWPSPMEPLEYDSDRDSPGVLPPPPDMNDHTEEEKKYILDKIQWANRELRDQEAPDLTRRRRLHFKDKLVDLVVPPLLFEKDSCSAEPEPGRRGGDRETSEAENDVSGRFSELKLSLREESVGCGGAFVSSVKDNKVLVEKDGKFDLVSLGKVDSRGLFPPIAHKSSTPSRSPSPRLEQTSSASSSSLNHHRGVSQLTQSADGLCVPRPPAQARSRPSSATPNQRGGPRQASRRRVQSATGTSCLATFTLSPQQKELLQRSQERRAKLAREAEERKREEEEQKRQENELAFKAWLMKKKEQLQEEKRILRAQEMEKMGSQKEPCDPQESFRLWLQRKQQQQQRERQLTEVKKLEQDCGHLLRSREDCERAFKLWLRRKRAEKRAEQQAAREHSRRLVLEERRARRVRDLQCVEDRPFRFSQHTLYQF